MRLRGEPGPCRGVLDEWDDFWCQEPGCVRHVRRVPAKTRVIFPDYGSSSGEQLELPFMGANVPSFVPFPSNR